MNQVRKRDGLVELTNPHALEGSPLWNRDIAPTTFADRHWNVWNIAALWVGMAVCIPTYMLASSLVGQGMSWSQAVLTIFLANVLVLVPMVLNAHAGTRYGIPFPVYCRMAYGTVGANVAALARGLVACGWFGIQTWIGGAALYSLALAVAPSLKDAPALGGLGLNAAEAVCFLVFWAINIAIVLRGLDSIRLLEALAAPFLILVGLALLAWAWAKAGGLGPMLSEPSKLATPEAFWPAFAAGLTANVAFWATLSLNIPDFTRFAKSQRDQVLGQAIGLPPTMTLFAFIGVAVTSATVVIFGAPIWDPVQVLSRAGEGNPLVVVVSMLALTIATLSTNLAANVVSPANDISNLSPRNISFKMGGVITGILGILIMPWKLVNNPDTYIFAWLGGYGQILTAIGGVLIAEYWVIRRTRLDVPDLYNPEGRYGRWNAVAFTATLVGVLPCLPGWLTRMQMLDFSGTWLLLADFSVFVSFALAFVTHVVLSRLLRAPELARQGLEVEIVPEPAGIV